MAGSFLPEPRRSNYRQLGESIAYTCHESYKQSPNQIGPILIDFSSPKNEAGSSSAPKGYKPFYEVAETYFILWRLTHRSKYRLWGREMMDAMKKYCNSGPQDVCFNAETAKIFQVFIYRPI